MPAVKTRPEPLATPVTDTATDQVAPVRRRCPISWTAASLAIILLGALAGVFLYNSASNAEQVLVAKHDLVRGHTITTEDLTTLAIAAGQSSDAISAKTPDQVIGQTLTSDVAPGGLITPGLFDTSLIVPEGNALVGVTVKPSNLPAQQLRAGDIVSLVALSSPGAATLTDTTIGPVRAVVSQVKTIANSSDQTVDVYVPTENAQDIAARAAAGLIVITLEANAESPVLPDESSAPAEVDAVQPDEGAVQP